MSRLNKSLLGLLSLLIFGWIVPNLLAQTWTTVWTPGSAPVEKTIAMDDTHDSKTECYPCKEREEYGDGTGKWVYTPEGGKPTACPGDNTDYACKVCDGKGNVVNATNGTNCAILMVVMESGKCCNGECFPVPQPGVDPCSWALDNKNLMSPVDQSKLQCGSDTMGYVLCIFGDKYACTVPCNFPSSWDQDMKNCILQEEINHLNSLTAQCPDCIGMAKYPDDQTQKDEECAARAATFACMEGLKAGASSWYQRIIRDAQIDIRNDMINKLHCSNIPPAP